MPSTRSEERSGRNNLPASVTVMLLILFTILSAACGSDRSGDRGTHGTGGDPKLTEEEAIGQVRVYLHDQTKVTRREECQEREECKQERQHCDQYDLDLDQEHRTCKESPSGSGRYYKTVQKCEKVTECQQEESAGPCKLPPPGGDWSAEYHEVGKWWEVVNVRPVNVRSSWTVNDLTRVIISHQPPC
jgi:hypothetical protein